MSADLTEVRKLVTVDDDNRIELADGDGINWTVVKVTSFNPLTVEIPEVGDAVTGPVKVQLPPVTLSVRRLLSKTFDPREEGPVIMATAPGLEYVFEARDGGVPVGELVQFIYDCRAEFAKAHGIMQAGLDERGALLEPVL